MISQKDQSLAQMSRNEVNNVLCICLLLMNNHRVYTTTLYAAVSHLDTDDQ